VDVAAEHADDHGKRERGVDGRGLAIAGSDLHPRRAGRDDLLRDADGAGRGVAQRITSDDLDRRGNGIGEWQSGEEERAVVNVAHIDCSGQTVDGDSQAREAAQKVSDATRNIGARGLNVGIRRGEVDGKAWRLGVLNDRQRRRRASDAAGGDGRDEQVVHPVGFEGDLAAEGAIRWSDGEHRHAARPGDLDLGADWRDACDLEGGLG
jgi:hypothetical protein